MKGFQTGPARSRKGCFLIFFLPLAIIAITFFFPVHEIIARFNQEDSDSE